MALDFTDASLLGYNVQFEFLGDQSFNHRKIINLQIQGNIAEGAQMVIGSQANGDTIRANNLAGVKESFRKINEQIAQAGDYWDEDIVINGTNWGRGRVRGVSFDSSPGTATDMIRYGQYSAELEVYKAGDLNLLHSESDMGDFAQDSSIESTIIHNAPQYINGLSHSLDLKQESDGSSTLNYSLNIDLMDGGSEVNTIQIAKSLAGVMIGKDDYGPLEDAFGVDYFFDNNGTAITNGPGQQWSEDYDLINNNFNFTRTAKILPEASTNNKHTGPAGYEYTSKTTRSLQKDENGIITVSERGEIESFAGDWFDMTGGMTTEIASSYTRCNGSFGYFIGNAAIPSIEGYADSLSSQYVSLGKQFDSGAGKGNWTVSFTNKSGYSSEAIHEYTSQITRDKNRIHSISTNGNITARASKQASWSKAGGDNNDNPAVLSTTVYQYIDLAKNDIVLLADQFLAWDEPNGNPGGFPYHQAGTFTEASRTIGWPEYGKTITYKLNYTDDPNIKNDADARIRTINSNVSDNAPVPMVKEFLVPSRGDKGEVVHDPGQTTIGTRSIQVQAQHYRLCNMSYVTGSESLTDGKPTSLYDFRLALQYMHNEAMFLAYDSPSQLNGVIDMWVDEVSYSFNSKGQLTYGLDLKYTAGHSNYPAFHLNYGGQA